MPSVFEKLNLKQQREIFVVNAPVSFEAELAALQGVTVLRVKPSPGQLPGQSAMAVTRSVPRR